MISLPYTHVQNQNFSVPPPSPMPVTILPPPAPVSPPTNDVTPAIVEQKIQEVEAKVDTQSDNNAMVRNYFESKSHSLLIEHQKSNLELFKVIHQALINLENKVEGIAKSVTEICDVLGKMSNNMYSMQDSQTHTFNLVNNIHDTVNNSSNKIADQIVSEQPKSKSKDKEVKVITTRTRPFPKPILTVKTK